MNLLFNSISCFPSDAVAAVVVTTGAAPDLTAGALVPETAAGAIRGTGAARTRTGLETSPRTGTRTRVAVGARRRKKREVESMVTGIRQKMKVNIPSYIGTSVFCFLYQSDKRDCKCVVFLDFLSEQSAPI